MGIRGDGYNLCHAPKGVMGVDERITIDVERLRDALVNETGPAAFAGSPWAIVDVAALEDASPLDLIREAERRGWDLRRFAVG